LVDEPDLGACDDVPALSVGFVTATLDEPRVGEGKSGSCCCDGILPLRRHFGPKGPQRRSGDEVALKVERVMDGSVHIEKALGRAEPGARPLTRRFLDQDPPQDPLDFHLTGGETSDTTQFETSLGLGPDITPRVVITDKGYDSRANRAAARERGITPVIPRKINATERGRFFPKPLYRLRERIEQTIGKAQTLQTPRAAVRQDNRLIRGVHQLRLQPGAVEIRPQDLA
jgi:hypothetical protein